MTSLRDHVTIRGKRVSDADPVFIVGEIACGHQGDVGQCKALIDAVADAGADAVQLEVTSAAEPLLDQVTRCSLTPTR